MVSTRTTAARSACWRTMRRSWRCSIPPSCGCTRPSRTSSASPRPRGTCRSPATGRCCLSRRPIDPDELDVCGAARAPRAGRARARVGRRGHRAAARGRARQAALGAVPDDRRGLALARSTYPAFVMVDERVLAERLISYDTSRPDELVAAAGFVKGWLESRDIEVRHTTTTACPCWSPRSGPATAIRRPLRGPPRPPRRRPGPARAVPAARRGRSADRPRRLRHEGRARGDDVRAQGRRAPGARPRAARLRARRGVRGARRALHRRASSSAGSGGDFAITGEPTDMHIGVEAKGVLVMRIDVHGRRRAQLDAVARRQRGAQGDRRVPRDRVAAVHAASPRSCSTGRRSISGGSRAATRSTWCPTSARWPSTSATCPVRTRARSSPRCARSRTSRSRARSSTRRCRVVAHRPLRARLREAVSRSIRGEVMSVGRDGASDAAAFIEAGIPAVEFGPAGAGHHGPEEWVSLSSLARYRRALADFVRVLPIWLEQSEPGRRGPARRSRADSA